MCPACALRVPCVCPACALRVPCVCPACVVSVHALCDPELLQLAMHRFSDIEPTKSLKDIHWNPKAQQRRQPRTVLEMQASSGHHASVAFLLDETSVGFRVTTETNQRNPIHVCCLVDTSGSMNSEAVVKTSDGIVRSNGLSLLDLVKHSVRTVAATLGEADMLSIVEYNLEAEIKLRPTNMVADKSVPDVVQRALASMQACGGTNIFDAMLQGVQLLTDTPCTSDCHRVIYLLTDGVPTIEPAVGTAHALAQVFADGIPHCVYTFGFGYDLDSRLLANIAVAGTGQFYFVPDAGFIGTCFIHAIVNTLMTHPNEVLHLQHAKLALSRSGLIQDEGFSAALLRRRVSKDRPTDFLCCLPNDQAALGGVRLHSLNNPVEEVSINHDSNPAAVHMQIARIVLAGTAWRLAETSYTDGTDHATMLACAKWRLCQLGHCGDEHLMQDLDGEMTRACEGLQTFKRWGAHYLRAMALSHGYQQCTNFKDPGLQGYATSPDFEAARGDAEATFLEMPPPTPTCLPPCQGGRAPPAISMATYHNNGNSCIDGECYVRVLTRWCSTPKRICEVRRGDLVQSNNGWSIVECLLSSTATELCTLPGGLRITNWHPTRSCGGGEWSFPVQRLDSSTQIVAPTTVYSILLADRALSVCVQDRYECVCLAHNSIDHPNLQHAFYGTEVVVEAMRTDPAFATGRAQLVQSSNNGLTASL